jgi:hypothetical protein
MAIKNNVRFRHLCMAQMDVGLGSDEEYECNMCNWLITSCSSLPSPSHIWQLVLSAIAWAQVSND